MKSAAMEFHAYNITINAVVPRLIDTPLTCDTDRYRLVMQEQMGTVPDNDLERLAADALATKTLLSLPWLLAADAALAYVYLALDDVRLVSGTALGVTGSDSVHNVGFRCNLRNATP